MWNKLPITIRTVAEGLGLFLKLFVKFSTDLRIVQPCSVYFIKLISLAAACGDQRVKPGFH